MPASYLMNSAVMPAGCHGTYHYAPMSAEDFGAFLRSRPILDAWEFARGSRSRGRGK